MTLDAVNQMDRDTFVDALGWIFERSPWVAERAWSRRPFVSIGELHIAMAMAVTEALPAEQLELIRAHPDLGTRARMTAASVDEQAGAGLDRLTAEEYNQLQHLNSAYREKFGFPFIYAVRGSTRHDILGALERRLTSDPADEYAMALTHIYGIARNRLEENIDA